MNDRRLTDGSSSLWASLKAALTFQSPITDSLKVSDWKTSIFPKLKGTPLPVEKELMESLAILSDRSAFLLGSSTFSLWLFDSEGKVLWRVKTPGGVWGVNTNDKVAVGALSDGTIRWYRISDGKELLAFYPHNDRKRWVLWTPFGVLRCLAWGRGLHRLARKQRQGAGRGLLPASRFRSTYYRPDVIDRVLETLDEAEAIRLANEESGRKPAAVSVREKLPPVVAILSPSDGTEVIPLRSS